MNRLEAAFDENTEMVVLVELEKYLTKPRRLEQRKAIDLMNLIDLFCSRPSDMRKEEIKFLRHDIWELKLGTMRMLFTVNCCNFAKGRPDLKFPARLQQAPKGSNTARATHIFEKNGQRTPLGEIQRAIGIAREDAVR